MKKNETDKPNKNRYNFEQNLLELSHSDKIDDALTEWFVINKNYELLSEGKVVCICNKTIKRVHYVCNLQTNKFAYLGTGCVGKFRKKLKHITNKTLRNVFMDMIGDGMYDRIFDLNKYSDEVKLRLIQHFENNEHFKNLDDKLKELKELIDNHDCCFLTALYDKYHCSCCKNPLNTYCDETMCSYCVRLSNESNVIVKNLHQQEEEHMKQQYRRTSLIKTCDVCGWENIPTFKNDIPFYFAECRRCVVAKQNQTLCNCSRPRKAIIHACKQPFCLKCNGRLSCLAKTT